ncbi:MAG: hypothetical protein ACC742_03580 [Thermoanaerobaculales bacterium]
MREKGLSTVGAVLLAGIAGMLTATLLVDWVVVDVQLDDPVHVKLPFPLLAANIAAGLIPESVFDGTEVPPEARAQRELVLATVRSLLDAPDATLVTVRTDEANVNIEKEGNNLLIAVDADDAVVHCRIPVDGVYEALENWDWEHFDPALIFNVLHAADNGNLVTVSTEDGVRVAVRLW